MDNKKFYYQLEGLRGVAILMVMVSHFLINPHFPQLIFLKAGAWGVNLFFVLSGFLITEILLRDVYGEKDKKSIVKQFYLKRVIRIFPVYYLCIILLAVFKVDDSQTILPFTLTYTFNIGRIWFGVDSPALMHIWSLCVEEQFYLIWPLLLVVIPRRHIKYLIGGIIVLAVITKALYYGFKGHNYLDFNLSFPVSSMDTLGVGALLAYLKINHTAFLKKILEWYVVPLLVTAIFIVMAGSFKADSWFYQVFSRLFFGVVGFYLVGLGAFSVNTWYGKFVTMKWLRFIGKISYGIYLYHWILFVLLKNWFFENWQLINFGIFYKLKYHAYLGSFLFFTVLTLVIAIPSFYFFEKPLLKLKARIT